MGVVEGWNEKRLVILPIRAAVPSWKQYTRKSGIMFYVQVCTLRRAMYVEELIEMVGWSVVLVEMVGGLVDWLVGSPSSLTRLVVVSPCVLR